MVFRFSPKSCCRLYWKARETRRPIIFPRPCSILDRAPGPPWTGAQGGRVAAILGREFDYPLFRAVVPGSDQDVQSALDALIRADLIYMQGRPPRATYQFKHALIRDAAYEGLLKTERRELHARVARTIGEQFPALAAAQPVLLARHWTEAAEAEPAIAAWKNAGQAALARCAFKEAEEAYRQASASLNRLPPSETRDRNELYLCSALVRVLQVTKGYSAPETMQLGTRARVLAERLGDLSQLFRQGARTWASIFFTGNYAAAALLAEQILEIALTESPNSSHLFFAHYAQVQARFYAGDLAGVEDHFAKLSPLLDTRSIAAAADLIIPIGVASRAAWQQGRVDVARERMSRAIGMASKSQTPMPSRWRCTSRVICTGVGRRRGGSRRWEFGCCPCRRSTGSAMPRTWRACCLAGPNHTSVTPLKAWN